MCFTSRKLAELDPSGKLNRVPAFNGIKSILNGMESQEKGLNAAFTSQAVSMLVRCIQQRSATFQAVSLEMRILNHGPHESAASGFTLET